MHCCTILFLLFFGFYANVVGYLQKGCLFDRPLLVTNIVFFFLLILCFKHVLDRFDVFFKLRHRNGRTRQSCSNKAPSVVLLATIKIDDCKLFLFDIMNLS